MSPDWFGMKGYGQVIREIEIRSAEEKSKNLAQAERVEKETEIFLNNWARGVINLENLSWILAMDEVDSSNREYAALVHIKRDSHGVPLLKTAVAQEKFQVRSVLSGRWLPSSMITETVPLADLEISKEDFVKWSESMGYTLPRVLQDLPIAEDVANDMVSPLARNAKRPAQEEKMLEIIIKKLRMNPMQLPQIHQEKMALRQSLSRLPWDWGLQKVR